MILIISWLSKPLKTEPYYLSLTCLSKCTPYMLIYACYFSVWNCLTLIGVYLEYKTLYARKRQNDATNKQSDHLENPTLATNKRFFSIFVRYWFPNNFSYIKNIIYIWIYFTRFLTLIFKSTKNLNTYLIRI